MRIIFFGSSDFAVPSLKALIRSHHQIVGMICQPDKPRGRGRKTCPLPVKAIATEAGLHIEQPPKASAPQSIERIRRLEPDVIVVVAYGQILSKELLAVPALGCINVHGSLLPRYRGASPIHWAIIEGEEITGVTTMKMDEGMDTGDIILKREIPIFPDETAGELADRMAHIGAEVLMETLTLYETGEVTLTRQKDELATYARLLKKKDGLIDWNRTAEHICRLIRGLTPQPGAFSFFNGRRIKVMQARALERQAGGNRPGQVIGVSREDGLVTAVGQDTLLGITLLQPENKRPMNVWEFIQGLHGEKLEGTYWSPS